MKGRAIGLVILLLGLLAGAVFVAARQLSSQQENPNPAESEPLVQLRDDSAAVSLPNRVIPAAELPAREPEARGIFVRCEDNTLIIGTGTVHMNVDMNDPQRRIVASHDGVEIEVVTHHETLIFRDETIVAGTTGPVPQIIRPMDSLAEVDELTYISAWGSRRGDRLVADLLVYSPER